MNNKQELQSGGNRLPSLALIGLGGFILFSQVFNINVGASIWPFFVILPGVPFLYFALKGGRHSAGLIFPGLLTSGTGLILLYQSIFNHYESWAYIWALYPVFIGLGLIFNGQRTNSNSEISTGRGMVRYGLMALVSLAIIFEVFIFQNLLGGLTQFILPLALIGTGVYFLKGRESSSMKSESPKRVIKRKRYDKVKNDDPYARLYDPSPKIDPDLQRQINEAIDE